MNKIKFIIILLLLSLPNICIAECHFNSASALPLLLVTDRLGTDEPRKVVLSNNRLLGTETTLAQLELRDADSLTLMDQLNAWSDSSREVDAAIIMAEPALLDQDVNGIADAVYVVDINGRVWFIALTEAGFARPELIADFSATGAKFLQPLQLVQTTYNVSHGSFGYFQRVKVSLVLIASHAVLGDSVILFNHQPQLSRLIYLSDLIDRTDLGSDDSDEELTESVWRDLQQSPGWLIQLAATVMLKPQIYAGVVYFVTVDFDTDTDTDADSERTVCAISSDDTTRLFAIHLHHAGKVYAKRSWRIEAIANASLQLNKSVDKLQLKLSSDLAQHVVVPEMLTITEGCADCTAGLKAADFPRTLRLATYLIEYGAW